MSKRIAQVNEVIRSIIGHILQQELELPPTVLVTVVKVETARDLKSCTIYISIIPDHKSLSTFKKINSRKNKIQSLLAQKLTTKFTPKISFKIDFTERKAARIENMLDKLK